MKTFANFEKITKKIISLDFPNIGIVWATEIVTQAKPWRWNSQKQIFFPGVFKSPVIACKIQMKDKSDKGQSLKINVYAKRFQL